MLNKWGDDGFRMNCSATLVYRGKNTWSLPHTKCKIQLWMVSQSICEKEVFKTWEENIRDYCYHLGGRTQSLKSRIPKQEKSLMEENF